MCENGFLQPLLTSPVTSGIAQALTLATAGCQTAVGPSAEFYLQTRRDREARAIMLRTNIHGLKLDWAWRFSQSCTSQSPSAQYVFRTQFIRMQALSARTHRNVEIEHRSIMQS